MKFSGDFIQQNKQLEKELFSRINANPIDKPLDQLTLALIEKKAKLSHQGNAASLKSQVNKTKAEYSKPWFRFFLRYNPEDYLSQIDIPVLALNGNLDIQVASKQNLAGLQQLFAKYHYRDTRVIELDKLNHLFQKAKTGYISEYNKIEQTFSPNALKIIVDWLNSRFN